MNFVQRIVSKALFKRIVLGGSAGREDSGDLHRASGDEHRELFLRACSAFVSLPGTHSSFPSCQPHSAADTVQGQRISSSTALLFCKHTTCIPNSRAFALLL